jgi:hypothetical protein
MKKLFSLPVLFVSAVLAAGCGKSNDAAIALAPAPIVVPPVDPVPHPIGVDPVVWCQQRGGAYLSGHNLCRIGETTQFGWNSYTGSINTGIMVYPNDSVSISASDSPSVSVGGRSYGAVGSFISQSSGTLVLHKGGFKFFRIHSVRLTRCYNTHGFGVACP